MSLLKNFRCIASRVYGSYHTGIPNNAAFLNKTKAPFTFSSISQIHTCSPLTAWSNPAGGPTRLLAYNKKVYPIQRPEEERRPAYVCHARLNIKYSPKKMWYIACLVRGMTIDEAVKQLSFLPHKGAQHAKEVLQEAQDLAVRDHNVEFKSNLWVAESYVGKGQVFKGLRRHARKRPGKIRYQHLHYCVRLEEGTPPEHYYATPKSGEDMLEAWKKKMEQRKIDLSL